jgi:hypothetical protein
VKAVPTSAVIENVDGRRRRRRRWLVPAAAAVAALSGSIVAGPVLTAGATGLGITTSVVSKLSTGTTPTVGHPVAAASAKLSVTSTAVDPVNGDVAIAAGAGVYLLVNATNEAATDFGIATSGTLVKGDVYLVAGKNVQTWPTYATVETGTVSATGTNVTPTRVAFDSAGNLLIAGKDATAASLLMVDPATATSANYGTTMHPGDVYALAGFYAAGEPLPAPGITLTSAVTFIAITAGSSLVHTTQDVVVQTSASGSTQVVDLLNFSSTSQSLFGTTESAGHATEIAGGGTTACSAGAQTLTTGAFPVSAFVSLYTGSTSTGNLYLGNDTATGCVWRLPATGATAGKAVKVAGNGINPLTTNPANGASAVSDEVGDVSALTVDLAGNVVLTMNSGGNGTINGVYVVAETAGPYYGASTTMTVGDLYVVVGGTGHTLAALDAPSSIGADSSGNLWLGDATAHVLDEITGAPTGVAVQKQSTSVSLTVAPSGTAYVLTATVTPSTVNGTVTFFIGGTTNLNTSNPTGVTVTSGVARLTVDLPSGHDSLTAVFTPSTATSATYKGATSTAVTYLVQSTVGLTTTAPATGTTSQGITITVTVRATGLFELTYTGPTTIPLTRPKYVAKSTGHATKNLLLSTGAIGTLTLTTTYNSDPGWTVTSLVGNFVNTTHSQYTIPGKDLGWTPHATDPTGGVTAGPGTTPGETTPSLAKTPGGALWASADATGGHNTTALTATLALQFPETTHPGLYDATFTVTAVQK